MSYPDHCLRGIPNDSYLQGGNVGSNLFYFGQQPRPDGWIEQSINWEDDDKAIGFTLKQRKDGEAQFKAGVAIVPRANVDSIMRLPTVRDALSYERCSLPDNCYHGNLLLLGGTPKLKMKQISASLALNVSKVVPQS